VNTPPVIRQETPDQPAVRALVEALDDYQRGLYPAESNHLLDLAALLRPEVLFAVARDVQGEAVGIAALVQQGDAGELKRMFVPTSQRGRGTAKALLAWLQAQALRRGLRRLQLETGIHQPEAIGLYERAGFVRRGPFGDYREDPLSVFMEKPLPALRFERLEPSDTLALQELAEVLHASVHAGASIGFVLPFERQEALAFWEGLLPAVRSGGRELWLARVDGRVMGTVSLVLDMLPNGRHRAEVSKLQVHPQARRFGLARALMLLIEERARVHERSLLVLDTRTGDGAEALYGSMGYELCGTIPDFARAHDGERLDSTSVMFKRLR
jgi:GNAT superfamily N-acetyltransferase